MNVEVIDGEVFRFMVESMTRPGVKHLVDLQEFAWNGQCGCEHFQMRCAPALRRGEKKRQCVHIKAARDSWFEAVGPKVAKAMGQTKARAGFVGRHL